MAELIQNQAYDRTFLMVSSLDHVTPAPGLTVTITLSKNAGPFLPPLGSIDEVGGGSYVIHLQPGDVNFLGDLDYKCIAIGADPNDFIDQVIPNPEVLTVSFTGITGARYLTRQIAQMYFNGRLGTEAWDSASPGDQDKALIQASTLIDNLNFAGDQTDPLQPLQFPRGGDVSIPQPIINACAEIALELLDDIDINREAANVNIQEHRFSGTSTRRDTEFTPEWILAGIPSVMAWNFLKPFLRDPNTLVLDRVT